MGQQFVSQFDQFGRGSEVVTRLRLLSGVSKRGTHLAESFLMPKISCRIWSTRFFEMPTVSAISRTFSRRSANTRSWIFGVFSSVVAVFGAPWRGSSNLDERPRLNSLNQVLMVASEGEESPYTASKQSLISLRDFPSKNKNLITDRYCSFSITLKSKDTFASTLGQSRTTSSSGLKF